MTELVRLEKQALQLMRERQFEAALSIWASIVEQRPDWEHGEAFLSLGYCQEELGFYDEACESYKRALQFEPMNSYYLGAYASFLYLHGAAEDSLSQYLKLLAVERTNPLAVKHMMPAIEELASRLQFSDEQLAWCIELALSGQFLTVAQIRTMQAKRDEN